MDRRLIYSLAAATVIAFLIGLKRHYGLRTTPLSVTRLSFHNENGRFRILQLTDLHLGESPSTDWGPEQDRKTFLLLRNIIAVEEPDLVVFSGDQITANNIDANATLYYNLLGDMMDQEFKIPYAMIFGNHDDMDRQVHLANGTQITFPAKTSRRELVRTDRHHKFSLTQEGPQPVFGVSNFVLNIYQGQHVKLQVVLLDSGGGQVEESVQQSQLQWYLTQRRLDVEAVIFQHIPTKEFRFNTSSCQGSNGDGGVAPLEVDALNETSFLATSDPNLLFIAVGHNHGNSYCCNTSPVLCFGRHSGYGGYGSWDRGARVFEFSIADGAPLQWTSYVRMEAGNITETFPF